MKAFLFLFFFMLCQPSWALIIPESEFKLTYILEDHYNFQGGINEKNVVNGLAFMELVAPRVELLPKLGMTEFYFSIMAYHGKSPVQQVGDLQWTSNIDTDANEGIKLYEAFITQELFSPDLRFRLGLMDLSLVYNVSEPALLFIHSSPGTSAEWGGSGPNGATIYPWPSLGADLQWEIHNGLYLYSAIMNEYAGNKKDPHLTQDQAAITQSENFHIFEFGKKFEDAKIGIGYWGYTTKLDHIDENKVDADGNPLQEIQNGWYFMSDMTVKERFHPFFRYGQTINQSTEPVRANLVTGITMDRPFNLEKDIVGIMYSPAYLSKYYVDASNKRDDVEAAYEIVYRHHFNQNYDGMLGYIYVQNPSGGTQQDDPNRTIDDANIIVTRFIFNI